MPRQPDFGWHDDDPIVNVSWLVASAYAQWAGAMLPTEAQWEKAARGTDGRRYPWGDEWDATRCQGSTKYGDAGHPAAAGSFPAGASPYGVLDMAGNVRQWCADWYEKDYYLTPPTLNPTGPINGTSRVQRGSSWVENHPRVFRAANRSSASPTTLSPLVGFRCVMMLAQVQRFKPAPGEVTATTVTLNRNSATTPPTISPATPPPAAQTTTPPPAQTPGTASENVAKPGEPTVGLLANISTGRSSSAVAVNPDTNRVYVLNFYISTMSIIDGATNKVITTIPIGEHPSALAINSVTNRIYVTHSNNNTIYVIDGDTNSVVAKITAASPSNCIVLNSVTNQAYLANIDGEWSVVDLNSNIIDTTKKISRKNINDMALNQALNQIYVTTDGEIWVIYGRTRGIINKVQLWKTPPGGIADNPVTGRMYVTFYDDNQIGVKVIEKKANTVLETVTVGKGPRGMMPSTQAIAVNHITNQIYMCNVDDNTVSVIDGFTNTVMATIPVSQQGLPFSSLTVNPMTNRVYVTSPDMGSVSVLDGNAFLTEEQREYAAQPHAPITNEVPEQFEEHFAADKIDTSRWMFIRDVDFPGSTIDIVNRGSAGRGLRLSMDMSKSPDAIRKVHGLRTKEPVIDFEKTTEVNFTLDWNNQGNLESKTVGVYLSPDKPAFPQSDARNYFQVKYYDETSPFGNGARIEIKVEGDDFGHIIYNKGFSYSLADFKYRTIGLQHIRIVIDIYYVDVWENDKQLCHYEFQDMERLHAPLPWTTGFLYLQQECNSGGGVEPAQPRDNAGGAFVPVAVPQEVFFSEISVRQLPDQPKLPSSIDRPTPR